MTSSKPSLLRRLLNAWQHNRRKLRCAIDLTEDGFIFTAWRRKTAMRWADINQIDAGIKDCFTFDVCYLVLFDKDTSVYIEELDDGFRQFENGLFERWPQIRARWDALLKAGPREVQYETLWRRDG